MPGLPALILAAGSGQRLGAGGPKALVELAGRPLYEWSVDALRQADSVSEIIVAVPPGRNEDFAADGIATVAGGASRSESVSNGLAWIAESPNPDPEVVLVHDAARPLVTAELVDAAVHALLSDSSLDAVIAAAPVTDTIKRVTGGHRVVETLDRSELVSVQTPQVFRVASLKAAIADGDLASATDDASLIESAGGAVGVIDSPSGNIKVTVPSDLDLAAYLLERNR